MFHIPNRYRDVVISPDGMKLYVITDSGGSALGYDRVPTDKNPNPGAILVFEYLPKTPRQLF